MLKFETVYPNLLIGQQPVAQLIKKQVKLITQQPAALIKKDKNLIGQQPVAQLQKSKKNLIVQQPAAQFNNKTYYLSNPLLVSIPWGQHILLIEKIKDKLPSVKQLQDEVKCFLKKIKSAKRK